MKGCFSLIFWFSNLEDLIEVVILTLQNVSIV